MYKILIILGVGGIISAFTPLAQANSVKQERDNQAPVTLSGDSLEAVENRSTESNYQKFFSSPMITEDGVIDPNRFSTQPQWQLSPDVIVEEDNSFENWDAVDVFPPAGDVGEDESVEIQYQFNNQE